MKYIESEVILSSMVLGMLKEHQRFIYEDEMLSFDLEFTTGLKEKYFPNEPLVSEHICHENVVKFYEKYSDYIEYSFLRKSLFIRTMEPDKLEAFIKRLLDVVNAWVKKVNPEE